MNRPLAPSGPLNGIRILDLTHFLAGPYATSILAEFGADVLKVEDPDRPDEARAVGPCFIGGQSVYYLALNAGKRAIALRLGTGRGRATLLRLASTADVVIDNFRGGVTARMHIDHPSLAAVNPRVITCSLTGYGEDGPYGNRPGYDYNIQAITGVMSLTGDPGSPPGKAGISYVDHAGGFAIVAGILAAILDRARTGQGCHLDLGLFDVQMSMMSYLAAWQLNSGHIPGRTAGGAHPFLVPAQTLPTSDGYLSLFVGHDAMWLRLCAAVAEPQLHDARFLEATGRHKHRDELLAILTRALRRRTTHEWVAVLSAVDVACAPVNSIADAIAEPQVSARNLIVRAAHDCYGEYVRVRGPFTKQTPDAPQSGAPLLGEHTVEILASAGFAEEEIADLVDDKTAYQNHGSRGDVLCYPAEHRGQEDQ